MTERSAPGQAPASASGNPAEQRPTWRFLLGSPWHFIALGAGSGLPAFAPGTWGTLAGWGAFVLIGRWLGPGQWLVAVGLAVLVGAFAAHRTGKALGQADSGHIVIDEIAAFWLVLALLPGQNPLAGESVAAFLLFRAFDIVKPPPIRWLDARLKHGIGVMLDDLLAALYTLLVLALWRHFAAA